MSKTCISCRWREDQLCLAPQNHSSTGQRTGLGRVLYWKYCSTQRDGVPGITDFFNVILSMNCCGPLGAWWKAKDS